MSYYISRSILAPSRGSLAENCCQFENHPGAPHSGTGRLASLLDALSYYLKARIASKSSRTLNVLLGDQYRWVR